MDKKTPQLLGNILGVIYGVALRVILEIDAFASFGNLVSISFFFLVPIVIGYIRIYYELKVSSDLTRTKILTLPWQPIFIFLLVSFVTFLEGVICIVMALPAFMAFSSLGGILAFAITKYVSHVKSTFTSILIIPFLLLPIEARLPKSNNIYEVTNSIVINASVDIVWSNLTSVDQIEPSEFPFSLTYLIGVPRPLHARMNGEGPEAVRVSTWEKGVEFKEIITHWEPNNHLGYRFEIDPTLIPDDALDRHVKLGGDYFSPLTGGYKIATTPNNETLLTLSTVVRDQTGFGIYSRVWGEIIFRDFHSSLLYLIKNRSESSS